MGMVGNSDQPLAGGPGFEPGTKVPKTLVIPFHHPPTERTDPTGALTREWCLPSPEGVYQRLPGALAVAHENAPRGAIRRWRQSETGPRGNRD